MVLFHYYYYIAVGWVLRYTEYTAISKGIPIFGVVQIRVFAENLTGFGVLRVCFLYKTNPNPRKKSFCCGKRRPKCHFSTELFSGVGLALGWGVRRFHNNIYIVSEPSRIWYIANTLVETNTPEYVIVVTYRRTYL